MSMILTRPVEETQEAEDNERLYTVEEFLELDLPDTDDIIYYELIGGQVVAKTIASVSGIHGRVISRIDKNLGNYAQPADDGPKSGDVYVSGPTLLGRPTGSNYLVPDVCYVAAGRTPENYSGPIPVAPDLVVEVNSPSDTVQGIYNKIQEYLTAGVQLVWSVYPLDKIVMVYRPGANYPVYLNSDDILDGGAVLPGFKVAVKNLFG